MTRETTLPIGVWLPVTAAAVVWWLLLPRAPDEAPAAPRSQPERPVAAPSASAARVPAPAPAPAPASPTASLAESLTESPAESPAGPQREAAPVVVEPAPMETPPSDRVAKGSVPESSAPAAAPAAIAPPPAAVEAAVAEAAPVAAPSAELPVDLPAGWLPFARPDEAELSARFDALAPLFAGDAEWLAWSGATLQGWCVIAPRAALPELAALIRARERLMGELLLPLARARAVEPVSPHTCGAATVVLAPADARWIRRVPSGTIVLPAEVATSELVATLTAAACADAAPTAPHWWHAGAVALIAAADGRAALQAPPATATLAPLFATVRAIDVADRASADAVAGSFAAWCLEGGDAHRRASFLESAQLGAAAETVDELAARFGCADLVELEARWRAARRR